MRAARVDARAMNFRCVAINDAGLPAQISRERWRGANTYRREEQSREHESSERHVSVPTPSSNVKILS
jgi:hypothetical protein